MSKHTPGPWGIMRQLNGITVYSEANNQDGFYLDADIADTGDCSLADARLIAAAPDLLAALEEIAEYAQYGTPVYPGSTVLDNARAAIRKAKGE